jgi:AmiR/NasT family two-component response regulator
VAIEQAKGMLAERGGVGMDEAFDGLRSYSRRTDRGLTDVASALVRGELELPEVAPERPARRR